MPLNINTDFLGDLEGFTTEGIIPRDKDGSILGSSGVTVGAGVDLGQQNEEKLREAGVRPDIIRKVKPYLEKRKDRAASLLAVRPLQLTEEEANEISDAIIVRDLDSLISRFNEEGRRKFEELTPQEQTVLASVNHQYGNLKERTPNFWKQMTGGDVVGAIENLRDFGDSYKTRRNKEADYLEGINGTIY